ncbi:hypothetical protein [Rufibacter tibetensis]|uniref:Polysaccharide chain length determinant N-terminal domain-containing protein n=1 Tax=Rufibacter tibetensis TaxID=512763 RepID=A0A0P0CL62_9BACT|nr:hypothetical protein [Rufibacter tibetensis]ALJ00323.1 hypothetical protein DC20_16785 [Rufibacter tibetensis]
MDKPSLREDRITDEIDLRIVFRKLGSFFKRFLNQFREAIFLLLRRWPLVLLLTLVGVGIGFLVYSLKKPYYQSSITVAPSEIRNEYFEDQVNRLYSLINDANFEVVASDLKITPEEASKIKSVKYVSIDHVRVAPDSVMAGSPFKVEVQLYDNQYFGPFQEALVGYFNRNPFFSRTTQAKKEQLSARIAKLKQDIASIDSMKQLAVNLRGPANGFVYGEPLDPTNLYKQSAALFETQSELEAELRNLETVQVVVGFAPLLHQTGPRFKLHLFLGAVGGFLLAFFVVMRIESRKNKSRNRFAEV